VPCSDLTLCPNAAAHDQKTYVPGSLPLCVLHAVTARDKNPAQQAPITRAMPASIGFFLGEFPSGKMRRHQKSWSMQASGTTPVQV